MTSLFRAFILALFFGGLSVGIHFLYKKFLNDESSDIQSSENPQGTAKTPVGNKVDITIADEELAEDESSPKFILTGQNQMLNKSDLESVSSANGSPSREDEALLNEKFDTEEAEPVKPSDSVSKGQDNESVEKKSAYSFKPVALGKSSGLESDEFPNIEDTLGSDSILNKPSVSGDDSIDEFPDMENSGSPLKDGVVTDSDFASDGKPKGRLAESVFPDGSMAESKDTGLMAEAIRTILKKEE
ncbi:MAG: hypothetical protein ACI4LX_07700 [Treponema sp.]